MSAEAAIPAAGLRPDQVTVAVSLLLADGGCHLG